MEWSFPLFPSNGIHAISLIATWEPLIIPNYPLSLSSLNMLSVAVIPKNFFVGSQLSNWNAFIFIVWPHYGNYSLTSFKLTFNDDKSYTAYSVSTMRLIFLSGLKAKCAIWGCFVGLYRQSESYFVLNQEVDKTPYQTLSLNKKFLIFYYFLRK